MGWNFRQIACFFLFCTSIRNTTSELNAFILKLTSHEKNVYTLIIYSTASHGIN